MDYHEEKKNDVTQEGCDFDDGVDAASPHTDGGGGNLADGYNAFLEFLKTPNVEADNSATKGATATSDAREHDAVNTATDPSPAKEEPSHARMGEKNVSLMTKAKLANGVDAPRMGQKSQSLMMLDRGCPFSGATGKMSRKQQMESLRNLNVRELASLGRTTKGKPRKLTQIPRGYRLETTGIRIDFIKPSTSTATKLGEKVFRGLIYAVSLTKNESSSKQIMLRVLELPKRNTPWWNGLHLRLQENEQFIVEIQERQEGGTNTNTKWVDSFAPVTIEPLTAFTVQDEDIAWLKTSIDGTDFAKSDLLFAELSLTKKSSTILNEAKDTNIMSRQRKLGSTKFEPSKPDAAEVKRNENMLHELLNTENPMTLQDQVHMKDIWNKCLGWIGMTGEHFVESLFLRCPDLLHHTFGEIPAELAFDMFVSIIDMAVRDLDNRTEVIGRESYRGAPLRPDIDAPFKTLDEGFMQFAQIGMQPRHWKEARVLFNIIMRNVNPYLEEDDEEMLCLGVESCVYRFWTHHIMKPALLAIKEVDDIFYSEDHRHKLSDSFKSLAEDKVRAGVLFYQNLFKTYPEVIPYFGRTDMDFLASHLFDAVELLVNVFNDFEKALPILRHLGKIHDIAKIPVFTYGAIGEVLDMTLRMALPQYGNGTPEGDKLAKLWTSLVNRTVLITSRISFVSERMLRKAFEWVDQTARELKWDAAYLAKRHFDIENEVRTKGTYTHTEEEIVHGARVAWRNTAKCVGRIAWNTLMVRDRRHVSNLNQIFAECLEHQRLATADGSLKSVMTVFAPRQPGTRMGTRFWIPQLVRFASYEIEDGSLIGDRANKAYTDECIELGWKPPEPRTEFDVLPVVIEDTVSGLVQMFVLPKEYHKVTMIEHPKYPDFAKLGLRWCVVPTVTCFTMKLGGLEYGCCPFNGWFMETEITRDLLEAGRMDKQAAIAKAIGVEEDEDDFWRERVAIETNKAVMHSFRRDKHSIVDHVTAQNQFLAHDAREKREGRECPAQWSWVVPAIGGSTLPIWHHEMRDFYIEPQYDYQAELFAVRKESKLAEDEVFDVAGPDENEFERILILYASVTGTAEAFAYRAKKAFRPLKVTVASCQSINPKTISSQCIVGGGVYSAVLFITSTFGEGLPPPSAEVFFKTLGSLPASTLSDVPFAVMAIGSSIYPDFCQAGIDLNKTLAGLGGKQILPLTKGDEVNQQEESVLQWITSVGSLFDLQQKQAIVLAGDSPDYVEDNDPISVELLPLDSEKVLAALADEKDLNDSIRVGASSSVHNSSAAVARLLPAGYKLCEVTMNDELVSFPSEESKKLYRSTRFVEFNLKGAVSQGEEKQDLVYETGDHARILPVNDSSVVLAMCQCLDLNPEQWIHINVEDGPAFTASTVRVGDLMAMELDLATSQGDGNLPLLKCLIKAARSSGDTSEQSSDELTRLEDITELILHSADLAKEEGGEGATSKALMREEARKNAINTLTEEYVTIPDLLQQFPVATSHVSLAEVLDVLPRLKPRHYSIASSSEMNPTKLQLSVGKLTVSSHKSTGKSRLGVCSHFLAARTTAAVTNASVDTPTNDVFLYKFHYARSLRYHGEHFPTTKR
mmetsp:Transcript_3234/g.7163  ORF Transcript_3234/g.7163 Transcript_3234/m.7163 type:complete len:1592 (+) Transcript_3234:138-4913(+)